MPAARARTSATRDASSRPGNSATTPTSPGVAKTTPTAGGCVEEGGPACAASFLAQATSAHTIRAARPTPTVRGEKNESCETGGSGMRVLCGSVDKAATGSCQREIKAVSSKARYFDVK